MADQLTAAPGASATPVAATAMTMVRMKLAVLRHSRSGQQGQMTVTGVALGGALALGTLWLSVTQSPEMLAAAYAVWLLGWLLGPVVMGGGDETLKPEHFSLLGLPPRRLATGLLMAAFVGYAPVVSLSALLGLLVAGVRLGVGNTLLAVPAIVLQLALFVLVSKVAVGALSLALRSRAGAIGAGVINGAIVAGLGQIWVFFWAFGETGVPGLVWWLPSAWGLRAVEGDVIALAALAVLDVLLLGIWAALLSRRTGARRVNARPRRPMTASTANGALIAKELRTWSRDLVRNHQLTFALSYGVCFGAAPLILGWNGMLPYAGPIFIVMAASMTSSLYAMDGTALWLTLMTPGATDVRGRQLAWLSAVAPVAVAVTVAFGAISGGPWPLLLALLPALLGGAAGLVPLVSIFGLVPGTDPHKRGGNPLRISEDNNGLTGLAYLMLALVAATGVPAGFVAVQYGWAGVPVGLASGALCWWFLGRLAEERLRSHGPELLHTMRTGRKPVSKTSSRFEDLPKSKQAIAWIGFGLGAIPLFPQGIVACVFLSNGQENHSWFLATYMEPGLRWPVAIGMIVLGVALYGMGVYVVRQPPATTEPPAEPPVERELTPPSPR